MRLGLDDAVIHKRPRHRVLVPAGGPFSPSSPSMRTPGEIGPVVQPVPVAVEIETRYEIAAALNGLIDVRFVPFVLRLAADFGVLKENRRMKERQFAIKLAAVVRQAPRLGVSVY